MFREEQIIRGFKVTCIHPIKQSEANWILLPGGPGISIQAYAPLYSNLSLQANLYGVEYPNSGDNCQGDYDFTHFLSDIEYLVNQFSNPILLTHSFSGMLALSIKGFKDSLKGLILMNSTPNNQWLSNILQRAQQYQLPNLANAYKHYVSNPSKETLKDYYLACIPYFFKPKQHDSAQALLSPLTYHHQAFDWAQQTFHPNYQYQWVPDNLPCLIIASKDDHITPHDAFYNDTQFHTKNITHQLINGASHFPWMDELNLIQELIYQFETNCQ